MHRVASHNMFSRCSYIFTISIIIIHHQGQQIPSPFSFPPHQVTGGAKSGKEEDRAVGSFVQLVLRDSFRELSWGWVGYLCGHVKASKGRGEWAASRLAKVYLV